MYQILANESDQPQPRWRQQPNEKKGGRGRSSYRSRSSSATTLSRSVSSESDMLSDTGGNQERESTYLESLVVRAHDAAPVHLPLFPLFSIALGLLLPPILLSLALAHHLSPVST